MAVKDDLITRSALFDGWVTKTLEVKSATYYVNAASFKFYVDCDSFWSWFVTWYCTARVVARYHNGTEWVKRFDVTVDGRNSNDSVYLKHNTTDPIFEDKSYYKYRDDETSKYYHLWCFQVTVGGNGGGSGEFEGFISTGTLNSPGTTQEMYDDVMKGRKIYSNGSLSTCIYEGTDDDAALDFFDSTKHRGTLIYPQHNKYLIPKGD